MNALMKYLHVIPPRETVIYPFVQMMDDFDENEHLFLITCEDKELVPKIAKCKNVEFLNKGSIFRNLRLFHKRIRSADRIIWHSIFLNPFYVVLLNVFSGILAKSAWAEWETDLASQYRGKNRAKRFYAKLRDRLQKKMALYIGTSVNSDIMLQSKFGTKALILQAEYPTGVDVLKTIENLKPNGSINKTVNILVGSNIDKKQNKTLISKLLVGYRYEDINLVIPLCEDDDKEKVFIDFTHKLYGEKAKCIKNDIEIEDYIKLLSGIDVAIYMTISRRVFNEIIILLYMGKKVFLADSSMLHSVLFDYGIRIDKTSFINDMLFEEFCQNDIINGEYDHLKELIDDNCLREKWVRVFERLEKIDKCNKDKKDLNGIYNTKFLHVVPPRQNIIYPFIKMMLENFDNNEHSFQVSHKNVSLAPRLAATENVRFFEGKSDLRNSKVFFSRLKKAEHIVFHSLYLRRLDILKLNFRTKLLKKAVWVEWGKDLYNWKSSTKSPLAPLHNFLLKRLREKMSGYVSIFQPDELVFRQKFKSKVPIYQVSYLAVNSIDLVKDAKPKTASERTAINIQIAHSCNEWNNHSQILDGLSKFRYDDIQLYIPLSTGAPQRNKRVVRHYANLLFGGKATCVMHEMEKEDYLTFLWDMDIAVFALYRQAGLGNIIRLLYMGKKVFLPKGSVMYDFFVNNGVEIYDTELIPEMTFEEFIEPPKSTQPNSFIVDMMAEDKLIEQWQTLYDAMQK